MPQPVTAPYKKQETRRDMAQTIWSVSKAVRQSGSQAVRQSGSQAPSPKTLAYAAKEGVQGEAVLSNR
jgi:hypothetical protein